ncbi:uncharacterized protein EV420DRAFT_403985 [Desarmillaria tabescens]|uniref:Uncharacterized protein n=1 Tax=Armillaria tabescens TaxID=1929756 RepID=A0AA39KBE4_ARMTA|nr:uncharacterized protein EV420DRAFT_403985 [Desarmillaria tabescens]KAK0457975.1 hypothetical protein EV420DRAFT_403985 [Desarmillaria tabescens]
MSSSRCIQTCSMPAFLFPQLFPTVPSQTTAPHPKPSGTCIFIDHGSPSCCVSWIGPPLDFASLLLATCHHLFIGSLPLPPLILNEPTTTNTSHWRVIRRGCTRRFESQKIPEEIALRSRPCSPLSGHNNPKFCLLVVMPAGVLKCCLLREHDWEEGGIVKQSFLFVRRRPHFKGLLYEA